MSATPPPPSSPSEPETTPEEYRQRALLLADLGRYDEAAGDIAAGLDAAPDDAALLATLARVHLAADQPAEALVAAERAVAAAPDTINPMVVRAMALADSRRFGDAAQVASGILRRWPQDPYAQRTGAALLSESRNGQEALNAAWHGVRVAPDEAEAHLVLAVVAARLRLFDLAQRAYGEALDLDAEIGDAQRDVGVVRLERRRWATALEALADAASLEPPSSPSSPSSSPSSPPSASPDTPYPSPFPRPYRMPDSSDTARVGESDDEDSGSGPGSAARGRSSSGPGSAGSPPSGPPIVGPPPTGPDAAGPGGAGSGPASVDPGSSGAAPSDPSAPGTPGSGRAEPGRPGPERAGSGTTGSGPAGSETTGSESAGPGITGSGSAEPGSHGSGSAEPGSHGSGSAEPGSAGSGITGSGSAGAGSAGAGSAGAGPAGAGPAGAGWGGSGSASSHRGPGESTFGGFFGGGARPSGAGRSAGDRRGHSDDGGAAAGSGRGSGREQGRGPGRSSGGGHDWFQPPGISRPAGPVLDHSEDSADAVRQTVLYGANGTLVAAVLVAGMTVISSGASRVWAGMIGVLILLAVLIWLSRCLTEPLARTLGRLRATDRRLAIAAYATLVAPVVFVAYALIGGPIPLVTGMVVAAAAELLVLTRRS